MHIVFGCGEQLGGDAVASVFGVDVDGFDAGGGGSVAVEDDDEAVDSAMVGGDEDSAVGFGEEVAKLAGGVGDGSREAGVF